MNKAMFFKLLRYYLFCVSVLTLVLLSIWLGSAFLIHRAIEFIPLVLLGTLAGAMVLLGIFAVIGIGLAVYHDAKRRGMEPLLWALVAALVPYFLGLIAYLIVRQQVQSTCRSCGRSVGSADPFCKHCGHALQNPCPACQRPVEASAQFCPQCGTRMTT